MLQNDWPDLIRGDENGFWEHEWDLHGKASGLDQESFFIKGVKLLSVVDLDRKLPKANIISRDNPYDIQFIKTELRKLMDGVEPILVCRGEKNHRLSAEIRSCLNMTDHFVACGHAGQQLPDIDCGLSSIVLFQS